MNDRTRQFNIVFGENTTEQALEDPQFDQAFEQAARGSEILTKMRKLEKLPVKTITEHSIKEEKLKVLVTEYDAEHPAEPKIVPVCDIDIIGKEEIFKNCGYNHEKKNLTAIERHAKVMGITIRHVNDNPHLDPMLKKSECNLICCRKLASDTKRYNKMVAK